jgi:hypothetical protein
MSGVDQKATKITVQMLSGISTIMIALPPSPIASDRIIDRGAVSKNRNPIPANLLLGLNSNQ